MSHPIDPLKQDFVLPEPLKQTIEHWISKYPTEHPQSALIPVLLISQSYYQGWLSQQLIETIADYLQVPRIQAYEVATFYSMLELKPVGKHKISLCTNVSCMLNGCDRIVKHLEKKLNITFGQTTSDGQFTLKEVECLGACVKAPVMLFDQTYHENLTPETIDRLLDEHS